MGYWHSEKFFDKVNNYKLIQIIKKQVKDSETLYLIRPFLKAGVMEKEYFQKLK